MDFDLEIIAVNNLCASSKKAVIVRTGWYTDINRSNICIALLEAQERRKKVGQQGGNYCVRKRTEVMLLLLTAGVAGAFLLNL